MNRDLFDPRKTMHKPFDYEKLVNLKEIANALRDIHSDIEIALDAIDIAERRRGINEHMQAAMILSGIEIKMTNFAAEMRRKFLV